MDKHALWKWLLFIGLLAWSMALVVPFDKIRLGLDLRGGASFTVQINEEEIFKQLRDEYRDLTDEQVRDRVPEAVRHAQAQALEIIRNRVDALGVSEPVIYPEQHNRIAVQIPGSTMEDQQRAEQLIKSAAFLEFSMVHEDNDTLVRNLFSRGLTPEGFRIVSMDDEGRRGEFYQRERVTDTESMGEDWRARIAGFQAPPGYRFMLEERLVNGHRLYTPYFVRQRHELKGDAVRGAKVEYNQLGQPYVMMQFDARGARRFARITADYAPGGARNPNPEGRRYLAIIMDDKLYSAPFIKTAIYGGDAIIEGSFSMQDAQDLAIVLRAGSLPAPVDIIESRIVDPSLGRDSIESGFRAAIFSGIVVMIFMLIYYQWGGLIADFGLLCTALLLPLGMLIASGVMGMFTGAAGGLPVLTMPGIAGIILTLGMAVDANVLIFERIREEQNLGKRFGPAVEAGYSKVFLTILDANVTTVLAAVILFIYGTGPIRGFGITLTAGILVSMYSALVLTRMFFDLLARRGVKRMRMASLFRVGHVNFIAGYKIALTVSVVVLIASSAWVGFRAWQDHTSVLGTDFTGGSSLTFSFQQKQDVEQIRSALADAGVRDAQIQYQREMDRDIEHLQVRSASGNGEQVKQTILEVFSDADFRVLSEDIIGPQIGREMVGRAIKALIYALIGMIIYISWRFEFAFAIGAIAALAHDLLICVGLYCLMGRQINLTVIAALLAIVGYSVNDTIVIFDRIREKLRAKPTDDPGQFKQLCNQSLNETLSRTILTSLTTFMAVCMLLIFGGGAINDFAMILFIGIIAGTYSTIYIATPVMLYLRRPGKKKTTAPKG